MTRLRSDKHPEGFVGRAEDKVVRLLQAWLIPILLSIIAALAYPLIASVRENEKSSSENAKSIAVLQQKVQSIDEKHSFRLDALEHRQEILEGQIHKR